MILGLFEEPQRVRRWEILDQGRRVALVPRGSGLTLGRQSGCDIRVDEAAVSSRHCVLTCLTGNTWLGFERL